MTKKQQKELKRQEKLRKQREKEARRGPFNVPAIIGAAVLIIAFCLVFIVFRNLIARRVITGSLENVFQARVEIRDLDVDLLHTRFMLDGLTVANKDEPMRNLFQVGRLEFYFNLSALTRGKVIAENMEITGVAWNTQRAASGALPRKPKAADTAPPNPMLQAIRQKIDQAASPLSVDAGINTAKNQLDPLAYLERERDALLSPALVDRVQTEVPALADKWQNTRGNVEDQYARIMQVVQQVSSIRVDAIKTAEEAQGALRIVQDAAAAAQDARTLGERLANNLGTDVQTVRILASDTESALNVDLARLRNMASSITSFNLDTGKALISDAVSSFFITTLGVYYPSIVQGTEIYSRIKTASAQKPSLKDKSSQVERLKGRTISFGKTLPRFHFKNVAISVFDEQIGWSLGGAAQNITGDPDVVGKPVTADLRGALGVKALGLTGTFDGRTKAAEPVNAAFNLTGFSLAIPATSTVPAIGGSLAFTGTAIHTAEGATTVQSSVQLLDTAIVPHPFEPAFISDIYAATLAEIRQVSLEFRATFYLEAFDFVFSSDADRVIAAALERQLNAQITRLRNEVREGAEEYITGLRQTYLSDLAAWTGTSGDVGDMVDKLKNADKLISGKQAEITARMQSMAAEKIDAAKTEAVDKAKSAASGAVDKAAGALRNLF
jgi:uncharacterized protein (TIGR03545 family)